MPEDNIAKLVESSTDKFNTANLILSLADWEERELPPPDCISGSWLTTTSRVLLWAPTGIGKTMFSMGLSMAMAADHTFLHWQAPRPARVLYIDGEMSSRLLKQRLIDGVARLGVRPDTFFALSWEDIPDFQPLNTAEGQAAIEAIIRRVRPDLISFDNIISLIAGSQKDEEGWSQTMPWIKSLTKRKIGQLWLHHTGHDETRSYGTKLREWQMDTVIKLEIVAREDTDVSFLLSFTKARERTPTNRHEFEDVRIALLGDTWTYQRASGARKQAPSPLGQKFLEVLRELAGNQPDLVEGIQVPRMFGCPTTSLEEWRKACVAHGLTGKNQSADFSRYKLELISRNWVACNETMAWVLP
jgi:AAA domain